MIGPESLLYVGLQRQQLENSMYFHTPADVYGINCFRLFMDEIGGGIPAMSRDLHVNENTVRRWLREETPVPRAAVLALFWESKWGRGQIFTEQVNEIRMLFGQNTILLEQYQKAKDIVAGLRTLHAGSANEPIFEELPELKNSFTSTFSLDGRHPVSPQPTSTPTPAPGTASPRAVEAMKAFDRTRAAAS